MKTIAIMNVKGGVGKTMTACNMAHILASDYNQRVLLVDADPSGNASAFFGASAEDETSPVARAALSLGLLGGEDDRFACRTLGVEFTATLYDKRSLGVFVAEDDSTRLDGERSAVSDIYPSVEEVFAFLERLRAGEDKLVVAVADGVAEEEVVRCAQTAVFRPVAVGLIGGFLGGLACYEGSTCDGYDCHQVEKISFHC